jgi:hypothetical protein
MKLIALSDTNGNESSEMHKEEESGHRHVVIFDRIESIRWRMSGKKDQFYRFFF